MSRFSGKIMMWIIWIIGSFVILVLAVWLWLFSGEPTIDKNYVLELNEFARPKFEINEAENAATFYDKAAELYVPFPEQAEDEFDPINRRSFSISQEQELMVRDWILENEQSIKLWIEGSAKSYYWREYTALDNDFTAMNMANLGGYRRVGMLLCWRAYFKAKDGDIKSGLDCLMSNCRAGGHKTGMKLLIEQLVGISIQVVNKNIILKIVDKFDVERDDIEDIKLELTRLCNNTDFRMDFSCERYFALDQVQRSFVTTMIGEHWYMKNSGSGELLWDKPTPTSIDFFKTLFFHPYKEECIDYTNLIYDSLIKHSIKYPYQLDGFQEAVNKEIGCNFMSDVILPRFDDYIFMGYNAKASVESAIIVLAAHIYEIDKGNFPETLDDLLSGGYIEEVPIDPFSGKPLVYIRKDDSFILYSVGPDKTDNQGRIEYDDEGKPVGMSWEEGYDTVFWPLNE